MTSADGSIENQIQTHSEIWELDILWVTAGLGCDGESVAMTAATEHRRHNLRSAARYTKSKIPQSDVCP